MYLKVIILLIFTLQVGLFADSINKQELSIMADSANEISIESLLIRTKEHYPLYQNKDLLDKAKELEITRLKMRFIPQIRLNGKATYQSDVTKLPFDSQFLNTIAPNINYKPLNRDQYNINIEISQPIVDSLHLWANSALVESKHKQQQASLESNLYNLQSTVINAFFSALLLERQIAQNNLYIATLQTHKNTISTKKQNGLAYKSDIDKIDIEILQSQKTRQSLQNEREIAFEVLFELGKIDANTKLILPNINDCIAYLKSIEMLLLHENTAESSLYKNFSNRPEVQFFKAKESEITLQKRQELSKSMPYLDVFIQAGYANPALNILKSGFRGYYIGGIRLNWDFSNLYTNHQQDEIIRLQKLQNTNATNEFLLNASIALKSQVKRANKLLLDITQNEKIIAMQTNITNTAKARLNNAELSVNDFLSELNTLNAMKIEQYYNEIELIMQIYQIRQSLNDWH